jgi:hypothetical protein
MNLTVEVSFSLKTDLVDHPVTLTLAEGVDVNTALRALVAKYPQVSSRIFTDRGMCIRTLMCSKTGGMLDSSVASRPHYKTVIT